MWKLFMVLFMLSVCRKGAAPENQTFWIIWNVGQGQWITQVTPQDCRHFDFGGEIHYFKNIQKRFIDLCGQKLNKLYLSHPDLDHYNFVTLIVNRAKSVCWMVYPQSFRQLTLKIPFCEAKKSSVALAKNQTIITECRFKDKNSCSTVFKRDYFLIPGDSPKSQEKQWLPKLLNKNQIKVSILGHHGSYTSTHPILFEQLRNLKMAVASARKKKYGHPHRQTVVTLKAHSIPLLRTESWGNLVFL